MLFLAAQSRLQSRFFCLKADEREKNQYKVNLYPFKWSKKSKLKATQIAYFIRMFAANNLQGIIFSGIISGFIFFNFNYFIRTHDFNCAEANKQSHKIKNFYKHR